MEKERTEMNSDAVDDDEKGRWDLIVPRHKLYSCLFFAESSGRPADLTVIVHIITQT